MCCVRGGGSGRASRNGASQCAPDFQSSGTKSRPDHTMARRIFYGRSSSFDECSAASENVIKTRPMARPLPSPPLVEVRRSKVQGRGVFATQPIRRGRRVIEYVGERITQAEADARYDDEESSRHHT